MQTNAFFQPREFYNRDINPLVNYVNQMATALSIANNVDFEKAQNFIRNGIKSGIFPNVRDPKVEFFGKDDHGDRTKEELPLSKYIQNTVENNQILTPTFTCYVHPHEEKSPISVFIGVNVEKRSIAKHLSQQAEAAGDIEVYFQQNVIQTNKKENNNSLSGGFATDSSIFQNPTGHNTLTSITRSMASIGNALNERMIGGNRHYRNKVIAVNNLIAMVHTMDLEVTELAMNKFGLHYPTTKDVMEMLKHSMKFYVIDKRAYQELQEFVEKLSPLQKACVTYTQDFYHLRKLNERFIFDMLSNFSNLEIKQNFEDPIKIIKNTDPMTVNYAHQVCIEMVKGQGKDYAKMQPEVVQTLANVCQNIDEYVSKYQFIIKAFFLTKTVPCSSAFIQDMVRKEVVLSDTDSTMFSVDEWVTWYFKELNFSQKAYGVAGAVMFITTQCIAHCLAILSGNMGVADENIYTLSMKPEFVFPVFIQSPVAKHYFTAMLVKEGQVYKDIKMEIKGVHNKSSANPPSITLPAQARMEEIIRKVMDNKKISITQEIKDVADIERAIIVSLKNSELEYFKRSSIKEASAYGEGPMESNFANHTQWEQVFSQKYGEIPPPPYDVIKVPTTLTSPSKFKKWLETMEDRELSARMIDWSTRFNKKQLPTFYFSLDYVLGSSVPKEVIDVIDYRKIVLDLTNVRRMLLDSLGFPVRPNYLLIEMGY